MLVREVKVVGVLLAGVLLLSCGADPDPEAGSATETVTVTATPEPTDSLDADPTDPTEPTEPTSDEPTSGSDGSVEPATYAEALARIDAGSVSHRVLGAWQSPSGNLHCRVEDNGFDGSCEVLEGRITPWDASVCAGGAGETTVGRIEIWDAEVRPVCNTDTIMNPDAPVLEYGAVARTEGFITCISETVGMTCVNTDLQRGFFLARGTYTIFGD